MYTISTRTLFFWGISAPSRWKKHRLKSCT